MMERTGWTWDQLMDTPERVYLAMDRIHTIKVKYDMVKQGEQNGFK